MNKFRSIFDKYIKDSEKRRRYVAFLLALSVFVMFFVPLGLMENADSMTLDTPGGAVLTQQLKYTVDNTKIVSNAIDLSTNNVLKSNVYLNGNCIYSDNGIEINNTTVTSNSASLEFEFSYTVTGCKFTDTTKAHFYFPLSIDTSDSSAYELTCNAATNTPITDGSWADDKNAGHFSVIDGYVYITLTEEYIRYLNSSTGAAKGALNFEGTLTATANDNDGCKLKVGEKEIQVDLKLPEKTLGNLTKTGSLVTDGENAGKEVKWTITLNKDAGFDLSEYHIEDTMLQKAKNSSVSVKSGDVIVGSYDNDKNITFNSEATSAQTITIEYTVVLDESETKLLLQDKLTNTACLKKGNDTSKDVSSTVSVNKPTISKNGTPDYADGGSYGKEINWTITINNNQRLSLNGYNVNDTNFPTSDNAITVEYNGKSSKLTASGGIITLPNDVGNPSSVTIKYTTAALAGTNSNTAILKYGDIEVSNTSKEVEYKNPSDLYTIEKSGTFDEDTSEITWTVKVTAKDGTTLTGYKLQDDNFPANLSDFTFKSAKKQYNNDIWGFADNANSYLDYTDTDKVLTFKSHNSEELTYIEFEYKTHHDKTETSQNVTNSIKLDNPNNNPVVSTSVAVEVKAKRSDSFTKVAEGNPSEVKSNNETNVTIKWKVTLISDDGFAGKIFTDTFNANGLPYSIQNVTVETRETKNGNKATLDSSKYSWSKTDNKDDYKTITFNSTFDDTNIHYVDIEYETVVTLPKVENESDYYANGVKEYTVTNSGSGFGTGPSPGVTIKRTNPNDNTGSVTIQKTWSNNDIPNDINSVSVYLEYGVNGTKYYVAGSNGKYSFTQNISDKTSFEVNRADDWKLTVSNLPKSTQLDDGTIVNFNWSVCEEKIGSDKTFNDNYVELDNGFVIKSENGTTVTNTYYPEKSLSITKKWEGDNGSGENVDSITVQVQRRVKGSWSEWKDYGEAKIISKSELTNNKSLGTFPTAEYDSNTKQVTEYEYRVIETGVTLNGKAMTREDVGNGTWRFVDSEGNYYKFQESSNAFSLDNVNTLTNTYYKKEDISITAKKQWQYETTNEYGVKSTTDVGGLTALKSVPAYTSIVDKALLGVQFTLERSANGNTWEIVNIENNPASLTNSLEHTWTNLPTQEFVDGKLVTYKYRVRESGYLKSGESQVIPITGDQMITSADSGYFEIVNNNAEVTAGGEVTITNKYIPPQTVQVVPHKNWHDDDSIKDQRPDSLVFYLQYNNGTGWADYKVNNQDVTATFNKSAQDEYAEGNGWDKYNVSPNDNALSNLPAYYMKLTGDNTYEKIKYKYRFVEKSMTVNSQTVVFTTDENDWYADTINAVSENVQFTDKISGKYEYTVNVNDSKSSGTFELKNEFKENIGIEKYSVDSNARKITSLETGDLEQYKHTLKDGKDYYVFNYVFEYTKKGEMYCISDDFPFEEGFSLVEEIDNVQYDGIFQEKSGNIHLQDGMNSKAAIWANNNKFVVTDGYYASPMNFVIDNTPEDYMTAEWVGYYGKTTDRNAPLISNKAFFQRYYYNNNTGDFIIGCLNITNSTATTYCAYSLKIECDKLEEKIANGSYSIINKAERLKENGTSEEIPVEADNILTITAPDNLINKDFAETKIPGYVKYTIDVNPDAKTLGNGSTVNITDVFDTISYTLRDNCTNHTHSQSTYNGSKLIDVLLNSINVYAYDANGNKSKLDSSKYTYVFRNGADAKEGVATLELNVPDATHISIEYTYKLIANENTPSVKNGCKSTTRVNGKFPIMQPGMIPPAGDKISMTNTARLETDSNSAEKTKNVDNYEITKSSGTISTTVLPKIQKVNIADYTVNNLEAEFLLAMYGKDESGKTGWIFATGIKDKKVEWAKSCSATIPNNAHTISLKGTPYEVNLSEGTLYKLIETKVPAGYEGSNLGLSDLQYEELIKNYVNTGNAECNNVDYSAFLNTFVFEHYFVYNASPSNIARPADLNTADVMQIQTGRSVDVPNNELIDISVKKNWIDTTKNDATLDKKIILQLYYSETNSSEIPSDAVIASASELGIMNGSYTPVMEVDGTATQKVWENLPNGKGLKPIYYYVKEIGYRIGNNLYMLDEDGTYKLAESYTSDSTTGEVTFVQNSTETGRYYPTYVDNARNSDGTVTINNSPVLKLRKVWTDAENKELSADSQKIGTDKITVEVYGVDANGVQTSAPLFTQELTRANIWTAELTVRKDVDLSIYKSFVVKETGLPSGTTYITSCTFNINNNTGEITVINKNPDAVSASVSVNKVWSDGEDVHKSDSIEVTLYQVDSKKAESLGNSPKESELITAGAKVYTPATTASTASDTETSATTTAPYNPVTLNADNNWSNVWTGLPLDDSDEHEDGKSTVEYTYYVVESKVNIKNDSDKYTARISLVQTGSNYAYTISNERPSITVKKEWYDEEGNLIEDSSKFPAESVEVRLYKEGETAPTNELKVVALGDSITAGSYSATTPQVAEAYRYPQKLKSKLSHKYSNINVSVLSKGQDGESIPSFENRLNDIGNDTDIVCLLGGTNDVSSSSGMRIDNKEEIYEEMTKRLDSLNGNIQNNTIFIGTIPYFNYYSAVEGGYKLTHGGSFWFNKGTYGIYDDNKIYTKEELDTWVNHCNDLIDEANRAIKDFAKKNNYVYLVDVNKALSDVSSLLIDGCHPNADGYEAIASAYYEAIVKYYTPKHYIAKSSTDTNILWTENVDDAKTYKITSQGNWTKVIDLPSDFDKDIKLSVEEVKTDPKLADWKVDYSNNQQTAFSSEVVTVENHYQPAKTSIQITKKWLNGSSDDTERDNLSFRILRSTNQHSTNAEDWLECDVNYDDPIVKNGDTWTISYSNLPVKDSAGNAYYYKIEEIPVEGYTLTGGDIFNGTAREATANTPLNFSATNTKSMSITVEKFWNDDKNHTGDTVTVKLWRTKNEENVPKDQNLSLMVKIGNEMLKDGDSISTGTNSKIALDINKSASDIEVESSDENVVYYQNGKFCSKDRGTATITIKSGNEKITFTVEVIPLIINAPDTIEVEKTGDVTVMYESKPLSVNDDVIFSSSDESVLKVDTDGKIHAVGIGTANVEVKYTPTGESKPLETSKAVTVTLPETFKISGAGSVKKGDSIVLSADKNYGTFEWSVEDGTGSGTITNNNNGTATFTGAKEGTVTITATREDGKTAPKTINVIPAMVTLTGDSIYNTEITLDNTKEINYIEVVCTQTGSWGGAELKLDSNTQAKFGFFSPDGYTLQGENQYKGESYKVIDSSTIQITFSIGTKASIMSFKSSGLQLSSLSYTIIYRDTATANYSLKANAVSIGDGEEPTETPETITENGITWTIKGEKQYTTIYISKSGNWQKTITGLDASYHYWVVEDLTDSKLGNYEASYSYNNGFNTLSITGKNGTAVIKNTPKTDFKGVEMPSTGGTGTKSYYAVGMMITGGAALTLFARRRKRKSA